MFFCGWMTANGFAQFTYTQITSGLTEVYEGGSMQYAIGDIDHDGDLDIVSVGDHSSPLIPAEHGIMVFKNNGSGTSWNKVMNGDFGYGGVALGDVNNDGHMDVAYGVHHNYSSTDFGIQLLEVVLGDGSGSNWTPYDDNLGQQGQSWGMEGCDFGDINNDGLLDLGANAFGCCDGVWIYENNGDGTWTTVGGALDLNSTGQFRFGDFNRDGKTDFVANNTYYQNQAFQIWQNTGNGQFSSMQNGIPFSDDYFYFDIGDINHDGAPDIALIYCGIPYVYTFDVFNNTWVSISNGLPTTSQNLWNIALGDMDGDGNLDLVTEKSYLITIYKGDGAGNWMQAATLPITETICRDIKLADFDHNGMADISYWAEINNTAFLRVYLNTFVSPESWVRAVTPLGGEFYCHGSVQFIRWNSCLPSGTAATVNLELSTTGAAGPFAPIATNLPNNGTYQWTVPGVSSGDCFIRYTLNAGANTYIDINNLPFSIDTCGESYIIPGPINGNTVICPGSTNTYLVPQILNCTGYTWTLPSGWSGSSGTNSITLTAGTQGGILSVVAHFSNGNSAPLSLYINVTTVDTTLTQSGWTLTAVQDSATYQWIDCSTGAPINGATQQSYTPSQNGTYAVILDLDGCKDTSSCRTVIVTGVEEVFGREEITLSPNPANNEILILSSLNIDVLELFPVTGNRLQHLEPGARKVTLDISTLPPGMYFIRVKTGNKLNFRQFIKL